MSSTDTLHLITTDVTALWVAPHSPGAVDEPITRDVPDHAAWLAALDAADESADRLSMHGRLDTELVAGEPFWVDEQTDDGWSHGYAAWQLSRHDERGYPGWVRTAHLAVAERQEVPPPPSARIAPLPEVFLDRARESTGVKYLWGGSSPEALDCSSLVHRSARWLGIVLPRDADDQSDQLPAVDIGDAQPGDLYFFAQSGRPVHHVGIVTGPHRMLHAPETGAAVVEEDLSADRRASLVGAGRIPGLLR